MHLGCAPFLLCVRAHLHNPKSEKKTAFQNSCVRVTHANVYHRSYSHNNLLYNSPFHLLTHSIIQSPTHFGWPTYSLSFFPYSFFPNPCFMLMVSPMKSFQCADEMLITTDVLHSSFVNLFANICFIMNPLSFLLCHCPLSFSSSIFQIRHLHFPPQGFSVTLPSSQLSCLLVYSGAGTGAHCR